MNRLLLMVLALFALSVEAMGQAPVQNAEVVTIEPKVVVVEKPKIECSTVPAAASNFKGTLIAAYKDKWPEYSSPWFFAGQVEQETCFSLTHKKCWNPRTENINPKNDGEHGFGLGQLTNTNRYNNFEDLKKRDSEFKAWKWEERFDPLFQLKAMIFMDQAGYKPFKDATDYNRSAFMFSAYNGGLGGVLADRKFCKQKQGCDPEVWFDNVETNSLKAKTKLSGYSVSAFHINREYVHNILKVRSDKYRCWFTN